MGASSRRYGAEKGLTGLTGLRSVLWGPQPQTILASGRPLDEGEIDQASWGWQCTLLRSWNFAVLQCRCPHVPVAHLLLCRHDSDSSALIITQILQRRGLRVVYSTDDSVSGPHVCWNMFCLERCVLL
jgi:hypothetical protein